MKYVDLVKASTHELLRLFNEEPHTMHVGGSSKGCGTRPIRVQTECWYGIIVFTFLPAEKVPDSPCTQVRIPHGQD